MLQRRAGNLTADLLQDALRALQLGVGDALAFSPVSSSTLFGGCMRRMVDIVAACSFPGGFHIQRFEGQVDFFHRCRAMPLVIVIGLRQH